MCNLKSLVRSVEIKEGTGLPWARVSYLGFYGLIKHHDQKQVGEEILLLLCLFFLFVCLVFVWLFEFFC